MPKLRLTLRWILFSQSLYSLVYYHDNIPYTPSDEQIIILLTTLLLKRFYAFPLHRMMLRLHGKILSAIFPLDGIKIVNTRGKL